MDLLGLPILILILVVVGAAQIAVTMGVMFAMHKYMRDRLPDTLYGQFDFDNFQKPAFQDLLIRLAVVLAGATLVIHLLDYVLVGGEIRRYRFTVRFFLFLFETGAITSGLYYLFKLDWLRLAILAGANAIFYLFILWYLTHGATLLV